MHVQMQNANVTAHVRKKSVSIKRIKERYKDWNELLGRFYFEQHFFFWNVWANLKQGGSESKLNSMHILCGANHTTRPGNLRSNHAQYMSRCRTHSLLPRLSEWAAPWNSRFFPTVTLSNDHPPITSMSFVKKPGTRTGNGRGCIYDCVDPAQCCFYQYPLKMFTFRVSCSACIREIARNLERPYYGNWRIRVHDNKRRTIKYTFLFF